MACVSEGGHVTPVTLPSLSFKHFKNYYLLFLAALDLGCSVQAFSNCGKQGLLSSCDAQAFIAMASLAAEHGP